MRRLACLCALAAGAILCVPVAAQASFGINNPDVTITESNGDPSTQAGTHPFALTASFGVNYSEETGKPVPEGRLKDLIIKQIAGLVGDTTAYPRCSTVDFLTHPSGPNKCPLDTAVGVSANSVTDPNGWYGTAVFNLTPPPGVLLRLGIHVVAVDVVVDVGLEASPPYLPVAAAHNVPESLYVFGNKTQLWGNPSDPEHDGQRGNCYAQNEVLAPGEEFEFKNGSPCPVSANPSPFLTLPTRCSGQNVTVFAVDSWENSGAFLANGEPDLTDPNWATESAELHDEEGNPQPFTGCEKLGFNPSITAKPTTKAAQSPTGLDFSLDVKDEGLTSIEGLAQSDIKKAVVTLPEGMTVNPSQAEGLEVCSEADLEKETLDAQPGQGCPEASKIGTVEVETPLVGEAIDGSLYVAKPYENLAGDSLIAVYMVFKSPQLGVIIKLPLRVEPDPKTGRLISITEDLPQVPFSHFRLHFREGGRSPLISPPSCGVYDGHDGAHEPVRAVLTPWSGGAPLETTSAFEIISGPDESPCPAGGVAPFHPGFEAGTVNNAAGAYSPFYMRLTRKDAEQDMTKFSAVLPPGVLGKIAGLSKCSDAAIAAAKARTGPHGGQEELEHPSCPASSRIGRTVGGAGVGSQLTYVPGSLYLAGPVGPDQLSVVAITPAVAGPFDAGTVVVREALTANPVTAEAEVDGSHSDPIPHILKGIPLNLRDLRVYADRPDFTFNATNCQASKARATLFGSYLQPLNPADDVPVDLSARYQAANCAALGFKPKLGIKLKGGTKRGGHPALTAVVTPRAGDANFAEAVVTLPHSAFLDQAHIRTICTRVQFAANGGNGGGCPKGSVYGHVTAWTPLLDEPLTGPVYLRSSNHNLPDLVFALHGLFDVDLSARIDSIHGGIRTSFENVPDAPVSRVVLKMQGAKKGLIINSRDLCGGKNRADAELSGQNDKVRDFRPLVQPQCGAARKRR
jgi:hypothetical protein